MNKKDEKDLYWVFEIVIPISIGAIVLICSSIGLFCVLKGACCGSKKKATSQKNEKNTGQRKDSSDLRHVASSKVGDHPGNDTICGTPGGDPAVEVLVQPREAPPQGPIEKLPDVPPIAALEPSVDNLSAQAIPGSVPCDVPEPSVDNLSAQAIPGSVPCDVPEPSVDNLGAQAIPGSIPCDEPDAQSTGASSDEVSQTGGFDPDKLSVVGSEESV